MKKEKNYETYDVYFEGRLMASITCDNLSHCKITNTITLYRDNEIVCILDSSKSIFRQIKI